jgi:hypothetical protein
MYVHEQTDWLLALTFLDRACLAIQKERLWLLPSSSKSVVASRKKAGLGVSRLVHYTLL